MIKSRKKIDLSDERNLIIGLITSNKLAREIIPIFDHKLLQSPYAKIISRWIVEYWYEYEKVPEKDIQEIYNHKRHKINNEEELELVSSFLEKLNEDWQKITNIDYIIKQSIKYLKKQSLKKLKEKLEACIEDENFLDAESLIANYKRIEQKSIEGVSILTDCEKIKNSFIEKNDKLFRLPGCLGEITGDFLRGDLVAFLSVMGRGKTWWQIYLSIVSMYYGYRVIFFSLEMPINQIVRRFWQAIKSRPRKDKEIEIPYFSKIDDKYIIKSKKVKFDGIDVNTIEDDQKTFKKYFRNGDIKIISLPANSATVNDISMHIDNMEYYNNYIPDIIIIDYADIIVSDNNRMEYRHTIDNIWKGLRRLAQDRNSLVASASQGTRAGFTRDVGEGDIAEDIRKLAHVSKMIAINQNQEEYKKSVVRISQLKERDGRRDWRKAVVLQNLSCGRPYLDSKFKEDTEY